MPESYLQRMMPAIERAAEAARERMSKLSKNVHVLWDVYNREKNSLVLTAADLEKNTTARLNNFHPEVTREEFEAYLLSNGVWADTDNWDGESSSR
jgi:hypothetical protein